MLISSNILCRRAIAAFTIAAIYGLPLAAQTNPSEEFFQDIQVGENTNWNFTSEDETISIQDNLKQLREYNISDSDPDLDIQLEEEDRRWGNNIGGPEEYSIETEIYDY